MRAIRLTIWTLICAMSLHAAQWGPLSGPAPTVRAAGPLKASRYYVAHGVIKQGRVTLDLPVDSPAGALIMVTGVQASAVTLDQGLQVKSRRYRTPDLQLMDIPETGTRVELGAVTPGMHRLTIMADADGIPVQLVVAEPESPVAMRVQVQPLAAHAGDPVTVTAAFPKAVHAAQVVATLDGGDVISLTDDGQGPDPVAGDGQYTGRFVAPDLDGQSAEAMRVDATGTLTDGVPFQRTATVAVMVSRPVTGLADDVNGDLMGLSLRLKPASGRFRVEAIYAANGRSVAYARESITLTGESGEVFLPRPAIAMMADHAVIRILNMDNLGLEQEITVPITPLERPGRKTVDRMQRQHRAVPPALPPSKAMAADRFGDHRATH